MDPVSAIASIITLYELASTVSSLCFRYGHGVRRADRDADLVIIEIDLFLKYLRTLREALAKEDAATGGLERLQNLSEIISGEAAALKLCRRELEDIKTTLIKVQSEGRTKEAIHKLSWPLKQEKVKKTLDTLKKFTEAADRALNVDNHEIIREIDSATKRIQISLQSAESNEERQKILDWLSFPDPSEIHEIVRHDRNDRAKTGRWFLDGSAFQEFKATSRSVLWLHGDSGCGKSVLCSAIIDEIVALQTRDPWIRLAYWYFSVTDKKFTLLDQFLRALIAQLVLERPIPYSLLDLWRARKEGREAPKIADLMQTIQKILVGEPSHKHFVVIDALDESDNIQRAELLGFLHSLALLEVDIHILVTSRTYTVGVENGMKDLTGFYNIAIEGRKAELDIAAHITERLENDSSLTKWSPDIRQSIKDTLIRDAGGMFRWVECQLQAIRKCRKPAEVRTTLKSLPRNLHEVYARELAKVDDSASQDVFRLLEWLAFPQRKLRIEEAVDMLAVDMESDHPAFHEDNRMVDSEEILKMWGSLVRLDTNAEGQNDMGDVAKVRTLTAAHTSVIDFLKSQPIRIGSKEVFKFSQTKANLRMAETCLIYLRDFSDKNLALTEKNIASYPFARLCASVWDDFYREVVASSERVDMTRLNGLVMHLFSSPTATLKWIRLPNPDRHKQEVDFDAATSEVKPAMYYAAHLGLPDIIQNLIRCGNQIDEVIGPPFGTPLVAASAMGRTDVVSLLLDNGADANLSGYYYYGTPLAAAIWFGNVETVKLLLGRAGIDINGRRHPPLKTTEEILETVEEWRKLQTRIMNDIRKEDNKQRRGRCTEIGTKLLDSAKRGGWIDFTQSTNAEGQEKMTGGISKDHDEALYRLFIGRADDAWLTIMRSSQSMVYIAAGRGDLNILEMLLAADADLNIQGGYFGTALQCACNIRDSEDIVETLLKNGAKTDVYGGHCGSPLNAACASGNIRNVQSLITAGVDVNRHHAHLEPSVYNSSSPLLTACYDGELEIAKVLVEAGTDLQVTNWIGHSALLATILSPETQLGLCDYLVRQGADPARGDKRGCNALHYAARAKKSDVIVRILEYGININATDHNGWTPLHWAVASTQYSADCISLLLQSGCDKSTRDKQGRTALDLAVTFKRTEESAILANTAQAYTNSSDRGKVWVDPPTEIRVCDGCEVERRYCEPETWHRCEDCKDFDFCFRCILDKDIIHFKEHSFSNEPA